MKDRERHIDIMGIVNLTDDSYFEESRCGTDPRQMVRKALSVIEEMLEDGATIIDLGACSTRPGSVPVGAEEEWRRLKPVLKALATRCPEVRISIDTYHSSVIRSAFDLLSDILGQEWTRRSLMVNDISSGEDDDAMLPLVAELGLVYMAMHKRGDSLTMQSLCDYEDVTAQVKAYFDEFALKAKACGIKEWILDPGFGFAKTLEQNYTLLRDLDVFSACGTEEDGQRRILVGVSRKSMIYKFLGISPDTALPATQVLHLKALQNGADILRVHDVAEAARTVALYRILG
jgi:dihydropteroate synthase